MLAFRASHHDLDSDAPFKVLFAPKGEGDFRPFAYKRGSLVCAVNPAGVQAVLPLKLKDIKRVLFALGNAEIRQQEVVLGPQSFVVIGQNK